MEKANLNKLIASMALALLAASLFTYAFPIRPASATGIIYIRPDGSIDPQTTDISTFDNITYTFTGNISGGIVVQRANIVLDGRGYVLSLDSTYGITVSVVNNVTIENVVIKGGQTGILLQYSAGSTITSNNISEYHEGLGIRLEGSDYTKIFGNRITDSIGYVGLGIWIGSDNNWVFENVLERNKSGGISIGSSNNTIENNTLSHNEGRLMGASRGISVYGSMNNITHNNISFSSYGIALASTDYYNPRANNIGQNSVKNTSSAGISLDNVTGNSISHNLIASSGWGAWIAKSSGNTIDDNNMTDNWFTVHLERSSGNAFYNNRFSGYKAHDIDLESVNSWDRGYPSGGNYWSNYPGFDFYSGPYQNESTCDGIGDTPYILNENDIDHYPLIIPYPERTPLAIPVASFTHSPAYPISGQTQTIFDASDSQCSNGTIVDYTWDFGDKTGAQGEVVNHTYNAYGNYNVTLILTSNTRSSVRKTELLVVRESPVAAFTFSSISIPSVGQPILFDASSSDPRGGTVTAYQWDFGDGNITSAVVPTLEHIYAVQATYNVTLTVPDSEGLNASSSQLIQVKMPTYVTVSTHTSPAFLGFTVDINGTLFDSYHNVLDNETVVIYYTFSGSNTWFSISSDSTDNAGNYHIQWSPSATGYFAIKAEWTGNATHLECASNVTLGVLPYQNQYVFSVESNSTISDLTFDTQTRKLRFTASGTNGTTGYTRVTVAKSLVPDITNLKVRIDGMEYNYTVADMDDSWVLAFTYNHSAHSMEVDLNPTAIPELPSTVILLLSAVLASVFVGILRKRKVIKS